MFGNTLDLTLDSVVVSSTKINQDGYTSEYLHKDTLFQLRVRIRHSKVAAKGTTPAKDRHNVEVVRTVFATATEAEVEQKAYFVMEQIPSDVDTELMRSLCQWATENAAANLASLMNWES